MLRNCCIVRVIVLCCLHSAAGPLIGHLRTNKAVYGSEMLSGTAWQESGGATCSCAVPSGVQGALQRALAASYAAVAEFQQRTGGQLQPVTKAGHVIY